MRLQQSIPGLLFAFGAGLLAAYFSYQWITDTERGARRAIEEAVVLQSRQLLTSYLGGDGEVEISDALDRVRAAGKVYVYPLEDGWELSGHYRRVGESSWHAWLMSLDADGELVLLAVEDDDPALRERAAADPLFSVTPAR